LFRVELFVASQRRDAAGLVLRAWPRACLLVFYERSSVLCPISPIAKGKRCCRCRCARLPLLPQAGAGAGAVAVALVSCVRLLRWLLFIRALLMTGTKK
jgi:hypothetical protein